MEPKRGQSEPTFSSIYSTLLSYPAPVLPPPKAHSQNLTNQIASLSLHPVLEAVLHILNSDLSSAHFLLRHMQAAPAYESMYLHGILHRVEGDYDNARAWYTNVHNSEVFRAVWSKGEPEAKHFITQLERLRKVGQGDGDALESESRKELEGVVKFCREKFGEGRVDDASDVWVQPSKEIKEMMQDMVVGGEGWRTF